MWAPIIIGPISLCSTGLFINSDCMKLKQTNGLMGQSSLALAASSSLLEDFKGANLWASKLRIIAKTPRPLGPKLVLLGQLFHISA